MSGPAPGLVASFGSTFLLTAANPMTILSFAAMFAGLSAGGGAKSAGITLASGVFVGSAIWWLFPTFAAHKLRAVARPRLVWINRASGVILIAFAGIVLIGTA